MKIKCTQLFFLLVAFQIYAQKKDYLFLNPKMDCFSYKQTIIPAALFSGGLILKNQSLNVQLESSFQKLFGMNFKTEVDNYLQYETVLQIYGGHLLGFKSKNDLAHQTINILVANAIMGGVVTTMKHFINETRPDGTAYSFPSGHTATAFTNAALLFYEYKDSNIWYASSGFLFASATGALRIANNKHYISDVLAGSGIGLGIGLAISYWSPFQSLVLKQNKTHAIVYPQIGTNYGIGLVIISN